MTVTNTIQTAADNIEQAKLIVLAGFLGSVLSMSFVDGMSKKQRVAAIISGMVMAHYLSPLIAYLFKEEDYQETIGFLIGIFGMSICSAIFRAIQTSDIWALIVQRFSGKASS